MVTCKLHLSYTCHSVLKSLLAGSIGGQCRLSPRRSVPVGIGPGASVAIGPCPGASVGIVPGSRAAVAVLNAVSVPPEVIPVTSDDVVATQRVTHFIHRARTNSLALKISEVKVLIFKFSSGWLPS